LLVTPTRSHSPTFPTAVRVPIQVVNPIIITAFNQWLPGGSGWWLGVVGVAAQFVIFPSYIFTGEYWDSKPPAQTIT